MPGGLSGATWISLHEVCAYPGVKLHAAMRRAERRNMPAAKSGKLWRLKAAAVDEYVMGGSAAEGQEASG